MRPSYLDISHYQSLIRDNLGGMIGAQLAMGLIFLATQPTTNYISGIVIGMLAGGWFSNLVNVRLWLNRLHECREDEARKDEFVAYYMNRN